MALFPVYKLFNIEPVKAQGSYIWDKNGQKYLDLYGGHAVISIGHNHPYFVEALKDQLDKIVFYSNSVENSLQRDLSEKLLQLSKLEEYSLFLCNSGAEANENALKLASFQTGRRKILCFEGAFHGRTSAAVALTDNVKIQAPLNQGHAFTRIPWADLPALEEAFQKEGESFAALIIEGIQGVGGVHIPSPEFLERAAQLCDSYGVLLILDEIQSGYGRSGNFFAFQRANIRPHIISMAKGMGNGFPIGGLLIRADIEAWLGMLGTTFGGNHLASRAGIAVLEVIQKENLMKNALEVGAFLRKSLGGIPEIKDIRAEGLMLGLDFEFQIASLRERLLFDAHIFTGYSGTNTLRLLPPLNLSMEEASIFVESLQAQLKKLS